VSFVARLGLAIASPQRAFAIAGERRNAGRSGSDLLLAILILIVATELRPLVQAIWIGAAVDPVLGLRALVSLLSDTVAIDLGFLVVAAAILTIAGGRMRDLGRAFDLACVAVLPLVLVDLAAGVATSIAHASPPDAVRWIVMAGSYGWTGALVALAVRASRRSVATAPAPRLATRAGWLVVAVAAAGAVVQLAWIAHHPDLVRPLKTGAKAPALALPAIGPNGALGARVDLTPGTVTVVDFWATWCMPCLRAMPALDRLARTHPDIRVWTVNLDDPVEARAIFDREHYTLGLLSDDGHASERYGVTAIPHTALIGTDGTLVVVNHGDIAHLEAEIGRLRR
jgi:thiol-disulfide isomerase/thioredoxin